MDMPTQTTLYRMYLAKLNPELRLKVLSKDWRIDGADKAPRRCETHQEVSLACGLALEERADIVAVGNTGYDSFMSLDDRGALVRPGGKGKGGAGAGAPKGDGTQACGYCHLAGHPQAACPQQAADKEAIRSTV